MAVSEHRLHPPFARYAHGSVVEPHSQLVFTSGTLGINKDGSIPESAEDQARLALGNVLEILRAAGANEKNIVRINAFVSHRDHLPAYMKARDETMGGVPPTASTLMVVSGFARPEFLVEVEAIAAVPRPHRRAQPRWRRGFATAARPTPDAVAACVAKARDAGVKVFTRADDDANQLRMIRKLSRDAFEYSPVLAKKLEGLEADAVAFAKTQDDVVAVVAAAVSENVPVVARGAGTGNYGQAVPLFGGIVLDLSGLDQIEKLDAERGTVLAGAGSLLSTIEDATRQQGWELRQHPSTRRNATLGGFVAGGSTGHGALLHGGLSEDGAVLGLRVVTAEATPRVLELRGRDVFPVVHAYGTNGIIVAVEVPLARAQPWVDVTACFSSLQEAAAFALDAGNAPSVPCRGAAVYQAPLAFKFLDKEPSIMHADRPSTDADHVALVQCAAAGVGPIQRLITDNGGEVTRVIEAEDAPRPMYEFGWNHTTLHCRRKDKSTTYLQSVLEPDKALELVQKVQDEFDASELLQHLECVRFGGKVGFASLALLWPSSHERLHEILAWHESNGMPIFNPHTEVLEDGGMKQTDFAQLGFKARADPGGVLNPGKMRAWDEQRATTSEAADPRGSFAASYRLADTSSLQDEDVSTKKRSRYWAEWKTTDFAGTDLSEAVAILPLAATEPHGPHLPLGVDAMHNKALLDRALKRLPDHILALALPPLDIGASGEHSRFAGNLDLSVDTASRLWRDLGRCVARTGLRKLILYNSHGGNQALAEVVARQLRLEHDLLCVLACNLNFSADHEAVQVFPQEELIYGIHGGALETSLMLHLKPDLVDLNAAKDFASRAARMPPATRTQLRMHAPGFTTKCGWLSHDLNAAGVVGNAKEAAAGRGRALADVAVANLVDLVTEVYEARVDDVLGNEVESPHRGPPVDAS